MKIGARFFVLAVASLVFLVAFNVNAQDEKQVCEKIEIDSAGIHGFNRSKIQGVARSHGLHGIADDVWIIPPLEGGALNVDIKQIIVMADVRFMASPNCAMLDNPKGIFSCAQSIPRHNLKLIVNFMGDDSTARRERFTSIMDYVLREVLCTSKGYGF